MPTQLGSRNLTKRLLMGAMMGAALVLGSGTMVSANDGSLDRIKAAKKVRIGVANINPYGYVEKDGRVTGQSPDLLRAFFAENGVTDVDAVVTDFGALIGGLLAGRFDIISTGMIIQPKRCEQIAFGDPEYQMGRAFIVKAGNPLALRSFKLVADSSTARMGLLVGAGEIRYAEIAGIPTDRRVLFPDIPTAIAGMQANRVDAVVASSVSLRAALEKVANSGLEITTLSEQPADEAGRRIMGFGGMGFRKEDVTLRTAWNDWLRKNRANGTVQKMIEKFGFGSETIPPADMTAEKACKEG